jgi:integral membrane protein
VPDDAVQGAAAVEGATAVEGHPAVSRRVLIRYRVMAYTTAVLLIVLVFVGIPLQVWNHQSIVARVVGTIHGYLYLVYLLAAFDLTRKLGVRLGWMVLVLLAGTVPFCAFVAERKLTALYNRSAVPPLAAAAPL